MENLAFTAEKLIEMHQMSKSVAQLSLKIKIIVNFVGMEELFIAVRDALDRII